MPRRAFSRIIFPNTSRNGIATSSSRRRHLPSSHQNEYHTAIFSNVYPDTSASAACVRTRSLMEGMLRMRSVGGSDDEPSTIHNENNNNNRVMYVTSSAASQQDQTVSPSLDSFPNGVTMHHLLPNRTQEFDELFSNHRHPSLDMVMFDRFFMEEQFSFQFLRKNSCHHPKEPPPPMMILDMQDMHSLRWGRQQLVLAHDKATQPPHGGDPFSCLANVMEYVPRLMTYDNDRDDTNLVRELSSIHRCDLTLVCSPYEMDLLQQRYGVPKEKLLLASFFVNDDNDVLGGKRARPGAVDFAVPPQFVFCGGFKHDPNVDAVTMLLHHIWPKLRSELLDATLHIYGAHCPDELQSRYGGDDDNHHRDGIYLHGYVPDLKDIFGPGNDAGPRILLAPLRFGAGIKGKIVDAWTYGMPVVTTPVGSEGMTVMGKNGVEMFGGSIATGLDDFCHAAAVMATDEYEYRRAQTAGQECLKALYSATANWSVVEDGLSRVLSSLNERRQNDASRAMLWHSSNRSTEFFSRWVELKERNKKE